MRPSKGFTLMELMIVVGVMAILSMIALPSFLEYSRKGKRAEAMTAIGDIQLRQERWRADNPTYGTLANLGYTNTGKNYTISIASNNATGYIVTANRTGSMANDPKCGNLILTVSATGAAKSVSSGNSDYCWRQ